MKRALGAGAAAIMLAMTACGSVGTTANEAGGANRSANTAMASNAQQEARGLPESERNQRLIREIRAAGFACQTVEESPLSQAPNATPVFMATCDDRAVYAVAVRDDGTMVVKEAMREEGK